MGLVLITLVIATAIGGPVVAGAGAMEGAPSASSELALPSTALQSAESVDVPAPASPAESSGEPIERRDSALRERGLDSTATGASSRTRAKPAAGESAPRQGPKARAASSRKRDTISKKNPYR